LWRALSEEIDEPSRYEFDVLEQKSLLIGQTAIVHDRAFGYVEFSANG
jgi:hypothetical protein